LICYRTIPREFQVQLRYIPGDSTGDVWLSRDFLERKVSKRLYCLYLASHIKKNVGASVLHYGIHTAITSGKRDMGIVEPVPLTADVHIRNIVATGHVSNVIDGSEEVIVDLRLGALKLVFTRAQA
jgi:hypothetical protein